MGCDRSVCGEPFPSLCEDCPLREAARGVPLRRRDGSIAAFAMVDAADFEVLSQWRWSLHSEGYAVRQGAGRRSILMHRLIAGLEHGDPREVDHENRDRLDCRRENLRVVPSRGNAQNVAARGRSRFRGVSWYAARGKWRAQVQHGSRRLTLGYFDDEVAAARTAEYVRRELMPYALPDPELAALAVA